MTIVQFSIYMAITFTFSCVACILNYSTTFKQSPYFVPLLSLLGLLPMIVWGLIAKKTIDVNKLFFYGWVWDFVITLVYTMIPIIFFNVDIDIKKGLGLSLIFVGTYLLKFN